MRCSRGRGCGCTPGAAPPQQFSRGVSAPPGSAGRQVLGIAHNAGNNAGTTRAALDHGADVIEIDVTTSRGGALVAGRTHGWRWLAERVFRGNTLAVAWNHAASARIIKLDLQQNDRDLLNALVDFLRGKADRPVMVSTRDPDAITYLRARLPPNVMLVFSVPFPEAETRVQSDTALSGAIGALSAFQGLITADLVSWAHQHNLLVLAWTINDTNRLDELLRLNIDGITTANLAILQALPTDRPRQAVTGSRRTTPPVTWPQPGRTGLRQAAV